MTFEESTDRVFAVLAFRLSLFSYQRVQLAMREVHRERSELYGREYDQVKVTYNNDVYFQQAEIALTNFLPFSSRILSPEVGRLKTWVSLIYDIIASTAKRVANEVSSTVENMIKEK